MHGPDGTERPEERTDPLLPVITNSMPPPIVTPKLPRLDDRTLAELLAELDGEDFVLAGDDPSADDAPDRRNGAHTDDSRSAPTRPAAEPPVGAPVPTEPPAAEPLVGTPVPGGRPAAEPPAIVEPSAAAAEPSAAAEPPVVPSARRPVARTLASPGAGAGLRPGRYVRREYRPPAAPAEAPSLTGLTRRSGGRLGSIAFTVVFAAIFLLILVQAVVSVLDAGM